MGFKQDSLCDPADELSKETSVRVRHSRGWSPGLPDSYTAYFCSALTRLSCQRRTCPRRLRKHSIFRMPRVLCYGSVSHNRGHILCISSGLYSNRGWRVPVRRHHSAILAQSTQYKYSLPSGNALFFSMEVGVD